MTTKIEWTDETWNPVTGCTPISPGCANCYANRMACRLAGRYGYPEAPHHFDVTLHPDRLDRPLKWRKPRMVFVCSMSDLFHDDVPFEFVDQVFGTMAEAKQHTFQLLTKRPGRALAYCDEWDYGDWVLPNVWFGVTIEHPDYLWRVAELLKIPAAIRFVSVEPMLGEIDLSAVVNPMEATAKDDPAMCSLIDWVICGAETGPGARPMQLDWARSLRDQCQVAGAPFFFKKDSDGNRELDGRLWEEMPR